MFIGDEPPIEKAVTDAEAVAVWTEELQRLQPETILEEAERLTSTDRHRDYDRPAQNHSQTAELWTAFLTRKLKAPITAREVCWLMVLLKASRDSHRSKRDSIVDAAGYLRNIEQMENDPL